MKKDTPPEQDDSSNSHSFRQLFYVDADVSRGWPEKEPKTLCKLGVTKKTASARCLENERTLRDKFGLEGEMAVVFEATGFITEVEKLVVEATRAWACEDLEGAPSTEWRICRPRQLARIAVLLALRIGKEDASLGSQRRPEGVPERFLPDLGVVREPVAPAPSARKSQAPGGPLPLARPRPYFHPPGV